MKIFIEPYQSVWVQMFHREEKNIHSVLFNFNPAIEHIGSTSVPGLAAKPVIDILVGLNNEEQLDKTITPMKEAGYIYMKKYTPLWRERRFFVKLKPGKKIIPQVIDEDDNRIIGKDFISLAHIHIIVKDTADWIRHIAFRNYLRTHSLVREEYERLKTKLSQHQYNDMNEYNDAKNSFIKKAEKKALEWFREED
ncbi:MAG TPA: GrpB family protein [Chitinophagaceae bacterium]|nr:GrpB family protein [Chitinophagaceae bacterium]